MLNHHLGYWLIVFSHQSKHIYYFNLCFPNFEFSFLLYIIYIFLINIKFFFSDLFYVRNHLPVPEIDVKDYTLDLTIEEETKKTLNLDALKKYKKYTITAAVMCGGNRRSEMAEVNLHCILTMIRNCFL